MSFKQKIDEVKAEIKSKKIEAKAYLKLAESEERDLTKAEKAAVDRIVDNEIVALADDLERLEKLEAFADDADRTHLPTSHIDPEDWVDGEPGTSKLSRQGHKPEIIKDVGGREIPVYSKGQSMAAWNQDKQIPNDTFGRYVVALATGQRDICPEFRNDLSTTDNAGGGFLVPNPLERQIIDRVRNASVLARAGARFIDLPAGDTRIATVESGASFSSVGEGEQIPTGGITFGSKLLNLHKRAVLIPMSVELLEDGFNAAQVVQDAVVKDAAEDLDNFIISGATDPSYIGLVDSTLITDTDDSTADIAWEDFHSMAIELRTANEMPTAYILNPTIAGNTDILTTGDGSTSAKSWLGAPPSLEGIQRLQTGNISTAYSIMADFSQLLIAVKQGTFRVEISREAGEYFGKDQVVLKLVYRCDYALTRNSAFRRLSGITITT
ncbi:MAG: phage major capsid protein [Planctomycetes bacterium]|nr:phage major capsid protein [Planctomycetota bacterium]